MSLLAICLLLGVAAARAAPNPVARFALDEGAGYRAADSSEYGHVGIVRAPGWTDGKLGKALCFAEPRSAVRVSSRRQLRLGEQVSIVAWIRPRAVDAAEDISRVIVAKNDEYLLRIDKPSEGGRISFFCHVGSPAVTWEPRVSSTVPPTPDVWHHVAVTWDGKALRLYLDGELQAERERTGMPNPNPYPVMIGNFEYPSCHGGNFGGCIDEVGIYAEALSEAQIRELWERP